MHWRGSQADSRSRSPAKFDTAEVDLGAGTGALCRMLSRLPGLLITALEPAPAMLARLRSKAEFQGIAAVEGFCDAVEDRHHFDAGQFDVVVSRQLVNGLFDRSAWTGIWQQEVDILPLAACQSTALTPYLLETAGFSIEAVRLMDAVNRMPSTRTPRYVVVATKHA